MRRAKPMKIMKNMMIAISSANNIDITRECLKSIPPGSKVIVYDDASTEPIEELCSEFKVELKKEAKPKGLTNLWNKAYADFLSSDKSSLLISNNDVIFPKGSIEEMAKVFYAEKPVILGPLSNKPGTGRNQRIGMYLCSINLDINDPSNAQIIQDMLLTLMTNKFIHDKYINGFCFMIGKAVNKYRYDSVHLFPPQKINIGNEDWLCNQIKRRGSNLTGPDFLICLTSFVFHYKGLTTRWCKKTSTKKGVNRENLWREQ
jgi:GT2 family glycosyltransferase